MNAGIFDPVEQLAQPLHALRRQGTVVVGFAWSRVFGYAMAKQINFHNRAAAEFRDGQMLFCHTDVLLRAACYLTFASAVTVLFGIAVSQILLALALVCLLLSGAKLRLPPIWLPLTVFLGLTLVSLAFSPDPAGGLPQVRKIYVYTILLASFSVLHDLTLIRRLFLCWAGAGALVAARGLIQYGRKAAEAAALGRSFYDYYMPERITGFMSHWMTFGGQLMLAWLMLAAFLLFGGKAARRSLWIWLLCFGVMAAALLLGWTRSIWMATGMASLYLAWYWRRWWVAAVPVVALIGLLLAPAPVRSRAMSIFQPHGEVDSNEHRIVTWRTGLRMIEAHPLVGLGPEQVGARFNEYVPRDIPWPLPTGWYGHLHNIYLHYAAERGIPAMLALLWMLLLMFRDYWRALQRLPAGPSDRRFILHGSIACLIAIMIGGIFELNLGDSEVLTMFLVIASCGYVAAETREESPERA